MDSTINGCTFAPSLIQAGRVISDCNDGTVLRMIWQQVSKCGPIITKCFQFSLRGNAAPVPVDARTVLISSANAYVYALDVLTGVPRMQRRSCVSRMVVRIFNV